MQDILRINALLWQGYIAGNSHLPGKWHFDGLELYDFLDSFC